MYVVYRVRKHSREGTMRRSAIVTLAMIFALALWTLPVAAASSVSVSGKVIAASSTGLTVERHDGATVALSYTVSTTFWKNGAPAAAGNILSNDRAEVKYDPGTMNALAVKAWTPKSRKITGMFDSASGDTFTVKLGHGKVISFHLEAGANVVKNGSPSSLDQLTTSDQVQVTFVKGSPNSAYTVKARTKPFRAVGTASSVGSHSLLLSTRTGPLTLSVDGQTRIRKSGNVVGLNSILEGDRAKVKYVDNGPGFYALEIEVDDPDDHEVKGQVVAVDTGAGNFTVDTGSTSMTFKVTSQTSIERDDVLISLADLAVGNYVEVKYISDGGDLVAISVEVKVRKSRASGTVLGVDTTAMTVTVQVNGTPVEFCVDPSTEIKKGDRRVPLGDLMAGDIVKVEYI
jgi:hypothetical protein